MKNLLFILLVFTISCKEKESKLTIDQAMKVIKDSMTKDEIYMNLIEVEGPLPNVKHFNFKATNLGFTNIGLDTAKALVKAWVDYIDLHRGILNNAEDVERSVLFDAIELRNKLNTYINDSSNPCKFVRIYFGKYRTSLNIIKAYLDSLSTDEINYSELYKNRISTILTFVDQDGQLLPNGVLLNLGGLCPPKCIENYPDPMW